MATTGACGSPSRIEASARPCSAGVRRRATAGVDDDSVHVPTDDGEVVVVRPNVTTMEMDWGKIIEIAIDIGKKL
jgi:hypothetical protein